MIDKKVFKDDVVLHNHNPSKPHFLTSTQVTFYKWKRKEKLEFQGMFWH